MTEWKVLNVNEETGKIDIVPSAQTTGKVTLQGAMGYNNAVYLLNDACSNLYSDSTKGITARSINMDDIENAMKEAGNESEIVEPIQTDREYTVNYKYPVIYSQEKLSVVNSNGILGLSEQAKLIERSEGTSTESYIGAITDSSSLIKPYQTKYNKSIITLLGNKENIILPNTDSTKYWIASRCIETSYSSCDFFVRGMSNGWLNSYIVFYSNNNVYKGSLGLFPVVTLDSELLTAEGESEFRVIE